MRGDAHVMAFYTNYKPGYCVLEARPHQPGQTIYWLDTNIVKNNRLINIANIHVADFDIWHKRLGHPSLDVLKRARGLKNFPQSLDFPTEQPLCRGCAEGKMHSRSFPESSSRATRAFQRVHSDLKSFPVESYHRYKYFISFLDDYSSNAWVSLLRHKSEAAKAARQFIAMVKTQHRTTVQEWMSDAGGEYKSHEFEQALKDLGIKVYTSVPHQPQQNGRAERFNRTIIKKGTSATIRRLPSSVLVGICSTARSAPV